MHLACDRGASPRELFASVFGMALFSDSFSIGVSYGSFCCGSSSTTASAPGSNMLSLVIRIHVWPDVYGAHLMISFTRPVSGVHFSVGGDDNWFLPFSAVVEFVCNSIRTFFYATLVFRFD
jgi:hypothetical protein